MKFNFWIQIEDFNCKEVTWKNLVLSVARHSLKEKLHSLNFINSASSNSLELESRLMDNSPQMQILVTCSGQEFNTLLFQQTWSSCQKT